MGFRVLNLGLRVWESGLPKIRAPSGALGRKPHLDLKDVSWGFRVPGLRV